MHVFFQIFFRLYSLSCLPFGNRLDSMESVECQTADDDNDDGNVACLLLRDSKNLTTT